jgi:hypothetical protein
MARLLKKDPVPNESSVFVNCDNRLDRNCQPRVFSKKVFFSDHQFKAWPELTLRLTRRALVCLRRDETKVSFVETPVEKLEDDKRGRLGKCYPTPHYKFTQSFFSLACQKRLKYFDGILVKLKVASSTKFGTVTDFELLRIKKSIKRT